MSRLIKAKVFNAIRYINKKRLKNRGFSLFSNDCWGGELYRYFELEYNTPFIGLYIMAPCYVRFLENPKKYVNQELKFKKNSKYEQVEKTMSAIGYRFPVGVIDDIEIQFMHYKSKEEALEKWNRRKSRINWDNLFVKFDGNKDGANDDLVRTYSSMNYDKICIMPENKDKYECIVAVKDWERDGALMFAKSIRYFDVPFWLNHKQIKTNFFQKILKYFI